MMSATHKSDFARQTEHGKSDSVLYLSARQIDLKTLIFAWISVYGNRCSPWAVDIGHQHSPRPAYDELSHREFIHIKPSEAVSR